MGQGNSRRIWLIPYWATGEPLAAVVTKSSYPSPGANIRKWSGTTANA